MSQTPGSREFRTRCECNEHIGFVAAASAWRERLKRFCTCNDCALIYNKCVDGSATYIEILDYFGKHVLTVDDNVLNSIYYNLVMNKNKALCDYITRINLISRSYRLLFDYADEFHLQPFLRLSTSMLMHDLLTKECKLEEIVYGGDSNIDLRNIWNDVELKYYAFNDARIDLSAMAKILLNKCMNNSRAFVDVDAFSDAILSEVNNSDAELCEHVTKDMIMFMLGSISKVLKEGVSHDVLIMEDASVQVDREAENNRPTRLRAVRTRKN